MVLRSVDLWCDTANHDKVYYMRIIPNGFFYDLAFQYGRRGSTLVKGFKVQGGSLTKAEHEFEIILKEKLGKGYRITDRFDGDPVAVKTPVKTKPVPVPRPAPAPVPAIDPAVYGTVAKIEW